MDDLALYQEIDTPFELQRLTAVNDEHLAIAKAKAANDKVEAVADSSVNADAQVKVEKVSPISDQSNGDADMANSTIAPHIAPYLERFRELRSKTHIKISHPLTAADLKQVKVFLSHVGETGPLFQGCTLLYGVPLPPADKTTDSRAHLSALKYIFDPESVRVLEECYGIEMSQVTQLASCFLRIPIEIELPNYQCLPKGPKLQPANTWLRFTIENEADGYDRGFLDDEYYEIYQFIERHAIDDRTPGFTAKLDINLNYIAEQSVKQLHSSLARQRCKVLSPRVKEPMRTWISRFKAVRIDGSETETSWNESGLKSTGVWP